MAGTANGAGSVLAGRFRLEDLLDENDGARFWRATDRTLARSVAVHVLPASDPRAGALLTAARSSALVSDPRLLRVLDAASTDGVVYVVNEWGSGVSLDRLLAEGPLSPRRAAWVVREVAESIATAHRNGVAHGRLLPENVMVSESGAVKIIGFVIDAVLRNQPGAASGSGQRLVTGGGPVGPHDSDVLNLAGLLYAALVGRWPGTEGSTIPPAPAEHGHPLRPRRVRAGVPRPLDAICERVLNASGSHSHLEPMRSAHDIFTSLSDYIGDPGGATALGDPVRSTGNVTLRWPSPGGTGSTAVGPGGDAGPDDDDPDPAERDEGSDEGRDTGVDVDTGELPATGAYPAPSRAGLPAAVDPATDPEATQASPMPFGGGWAPGAGEGAPLGGWSGTEPTARVDDGAARPEAQREARPETRGASTQATAAPPAAAEQPDPRPLFGQRRYPVTGDGRPGSPATSLGEDTGSFTGEQRSTGAGNGRLPPTWGPDSDQRPDRPAGPGDEARSVPGRTWLRLAVVLGVVLTLVVAVVLAFNLGRGGSGADPTPATESTASASGAARASARVPIRGVRDFDPQGDPAEENPDLAGLAVDGNPGTAWRTSTYYDPIEKLKSGVGLLVDLGRSTRVGDVRLTLLGRPTSVEILAGPDDAAAPTSTDDLDTVATAARAGAKVDIELDTPVTTRWMVVWLTSLPTVPGGYQGRVAEISLRS